MADILKPKRGKKSTIEAINPILADGEVVFEKKNDGSTAYGVIKMGDGVTPYNDLDPFIEAVTNYIPESQRGIPGGFAPLNFSGKIDPAYIPNSIDEVLEYPTKEDFPFPGEQGKIYIDMSELSNNVYRWSGSFYINISPNVTYQLEKVDSTVTLKCSDGTQSSVSGIGGVEIRTTEPTQAELYNGKMWIVKNSNNNS